MAVWTDPGQCSSCIFCSMDMDLDPFCVHPNILKEYSWGLNINSAIKKFCSSDLKLREEEKHG